MPHKLIYTSAPRLLQAGRSGFGTVAMSRGIPTEVVKAAENFSQFSRQPGMESARVVYSYRIVRCGDGVRHVLSCIRDAGADYSGRTNHLAQHLIFDDREAAACASSGFTPAGVLLGTEWPNHDGYCGWIESAPQWASSDPEPTWQWWTHYSSSPECRFNLCTQTALRGSVFVYGKGLEKQTENEAKSVLCLFAESQLECPNRGWGVTFTTSYEPNDELSDFKWIGVPENSPLLTKLETSVGREWVTLDTPPAARPALKAIAKPSDKQAGQDGRPAGLQDAEVYSGGPALAGANKTASPPPIRARDEKPREQARSSLFSTRNIAIFALSLVALLAAVFLLRSVFAPIEVQLDSATLKTTYNGSSHAAQILKGPPEAKILYAKMGTESWSTNAPANGGTYRLKLEVPGLFRTKVVPLGENLVIERQKPKIRFPDNLEFEHDGNEPKIEPTITPAEAAAGYQIVYKARGTSEWTNSPPRGAGEHLVQASTIETPNYYAVTNEAVFTIKRAAAAAQSSVSDLVEGQQRDGVSISVTAAPETVNQSASGRLVVLPERESTRWMSQIENLPQEKPEKVVFREVTSSDVAEGKEWQETGFAWTMGTNGLPSQKQADFEDIALNYSLNFKSGLKIQVLELATGAGAAIQKMFGTGPFYLQRVSGEGNKIRLAPSDFFSPSLEALPKGAFFEVSFDTEFFTFPKLKFQRGSSGWESKVPIEELSRKEMEAKSLVESLKGPPPKTPAEMYYEQAKKWILRGVDEGSHEIAKKVSALQRDAKSLGEAKKDSEVMKELLTDLVKQLEPFVPLDERQLKDKEKAKTEGAGADALRQVDTHLLSADELRSRLGSLDSASKMVQETKEWVDAREQSIGSSDKDRALREVFDEIEGGLWAPETPQMVSKAPTSNKLSEAENTARRDNLARVFAENLGVPSDKPGGIKGKLALVYENNGQVLQIVIDESIGIQPARAP